MEPPNRFTISLKQIWPTVYRVINGIIYFLLHFLKNLVQLSIKQIKGSL